MTVFECCVIGETPVLWEPDDKLLTRRYAFVPQNTSPKEAEMRGILALCAVALLTVSAMAQDKPAAKAAKPATPKQQQAMGGMPPMPKPSPEMQKMTKTFAGKWTAVVKAEAMGSMPASESKGDATFVRGPGGMSLIEDFHTEGGMGSFRGHGVTYWDDNAKSFAGIWCDTMSPKGCDNAGTSKWEGDKVVGYMEMPDETGKVQKYRMTYSDIKPDSVTFTMEMPGGGSYKTMMTIVYTRPAPPSAAKK
jgi:hypothetical protein